MSVERFLSAYINYDAPKEFPKWENEAVDSYWFMSNAYPIVALLSVYLLFVTALGPRLMRDRKPFSLKYLMMAYNVFQVAYNLWFLWLFFRENHALKYFMDEACYPHTPSKNRYLRMFGLKITWIWFISKVSDLLDTVFFVLRKKQSQVSFLHLYHHTHMVAMTWLFMKHVRGEQAVMIGLVNSSVHVVMYSYYFLSALGPHVQKYLWWKKYITRLQLFLVLMAYFLTLLASCRLPPAQAAYNLYAVVQGLIFTFLFLNFYLKSYSKPAKKVSGLPLGVSSGAEEVHVPRVRNRTAGL